MERVREAVLTGSRPRKRRRALVSLVSLAAAVALLASCSSSGSNSGSGSESNSGSTSSSGTDSSSYTLKLGGTATGSDALIWSWVQDHNLLPKYHLKVDRTTTSDFTALYSDFAAGRYDMCLGTISGFAPLAARSQPIRILDMYSTDNSFIVAKRKLKIPDDLKGLSIAAPTTSGTYRVFAALLKNAYNFDLSKQAKVLPSSNGAAAVLQVGSGAADAAFVFEPAASTALLKYKNLNLQTTFSTNEAFKAKFNGEPLYTSTFAYNYKAGIPDSVLKNFDALIAEATKEIMADPATADKLAQKLAHTYPGAYKASLTSGRQTFSTTTVSQQEQAVKDQVKMLSDTGVLKGSVPDSFYGPSPLG